MFQLTCICLAEGGIHVTHIIGNDLGQRSGTLLLRAVLHDLCLGLGENDTYTSQSCCLPGHSLTHEVGNGSGILLARIQTVLLR